MYLDEVFQQNVVADIVCGNTQTTRGLYIPAPNIVSLDLFIGGSLCHPASFIRKKLLLENKYDESLKICSDWKFFLQVLIFMDATYKAINIDVSLFDSDGVSSLNFELRKSEQQKVLKEMIPPNILIDYEIFQGYHDSYHHLFYRISHSSQKLFIYRFVVIVLKILCLNRGWIHDFKIIKCRI
jgi:hypothetical protein